MCRRPSSTRANQRAFLRQPLSYTAEASRASWRVPAAARLVAFRPVCPIGEGLQSASVFEHLQSLVFGEAEFTGKMSSLDRHFAIGKGFTALLCFFVHNANLSAFR